MKKYLINYVKELHSHGLNDNLKKIKHIYKNLESFIEHYTIKHPYETSIILGEKKGGSKLIDNTIVKLDNISTLFSTYTKTNLPAIIKDTNEISGKLDFLLSNINDLVDQLSNKPVGNELQTLLTNIQHMTDGIAITKDMGQVKLPVIPPIEKIKGINTSIETMFNEITDSIRGISDITDFNLKEREINGKIEKLRELLGTASSTITKIRKILTKEITSIREDYKFTFVSDNCRFTRTKDDFIKAMVEDVKKPDSKYKVMFETYKNSKAKENIKLRNLINQYNISLNLTSGIGLSGDGDEQYDGTNTHRIVNNFVINDTTAIQKIDLLQNILDTRDPVNFVEIYSPDLTNTKFKTGGTIKELQESNIDLGKQIEHFHEMYDDYNKLTKIYNRYQVDNTVHTMFLILIVTNQLFTQNYVIYHYVSKGVLTFYKRSIDEILEKIRLGDPGEIYKYFNKYHKVTLLKLQSFIEELVKKMGPTSVINIRKCKGETANRFMIFNYFKNIIDSYKQYFQSKISIYARINDITKISDIDKIFSSDSANYRKMNIDYTKCAGTANATSKFNNGVMFTEVFDTLGYPQNNAIAKYMSIDSQLAKQKGVALLTYGYSGTGKTYTLFGSVGVEGILQAVLNDVVGIKQIDFRLFEIYGLGVPYSYYWTGEDGKPRLQNINHVIYNHRIRLSGNDIDYMDSQHTETINAENISNFINCKSCNTTDGTCVCNYVTISNLNLEDVLKRFSDFMDKVDLHRIAEKRIRQTPNNNVSSRSILVYDFKITLSNSKKKSDGSEEQTQFLIVDLPGREEILQTYIDTYFNTYQVMNIYRTSKSLPGQLSSQANATFQRTSEELKVKMMMASMALNPIGVSIYADDLMDVFNDELTLEERKIVLFKTFDGKTLVDGIILDDKINYNPEPPNSLEAFADIKNDKINVKRNYSWGYGFDKNNKYQYRALIGIYIMNHLLLAGNFDTIEKIFKKLIDKHFNDPLCREINSLSDVEIERRLEELKNINFKGETIRQFQEIFKKPYHSLSPEDKLYLDILFKDYAVSYDDSQFNSTFSDKNKLNKLLLRKVYTYDYIRTPLEGIYINENIMGLVKYMIDKLSTVSQTSNSIFQEQQIIQQIPIDFNFKRDESRMLLATNIHEKLHHITYSHSDPKPNTPTFNLNYGYIVKSSDIVEDETPGSSRNTIYYSLSVDPDTQIGNYLLGSFFHFGNWEETRSEYTKYKSEKTLFYPERTLQDGRKVKLPVYKSGTMKYYGVGNVKGTELKIDIPHKLFNITGTQVDFIHSRLQEEYKTLKESYKPDKLFNFEHPLVQDILEVYLKTISEYKMFYLLGNYNDDRKDLKCEHQINLLEQSIDFISDVETSNKTLYNLSGKLY
jgi:hypothetical protein